MKKIKLSQNKYALVDNDDFEQLSKYKWSAYRGTNTWYAHRVENKKHISMHRVVLKTPKGLLSDHRDGNGLNNQKKNLRIATSAENRHNSVKPCTNTSGFKGVFWSKEKNLWSVEIVNNYKVIFLGYFKDKITAAKVYNHNAKKIFGEFAKLNGINTRIAKK